jgi:hypothetical protein
MKKIACLAAALAALAAPANLGCRGSDSSSSSAGNSPAAPAASAPAPSPSQSPAAPPPLAPSPSPPAPSPPAPAAPVTKAFAGDIEKLCDVVRLSGAADDPADDRRLPIAQWLAKNLTTTESRQFLARIQPLVGHEKADALEAEARRVGLAGCALAAEWRQAPTP